MINRYGVFILWALFLTPSLAFAHSPIKGIDNFYNGLLHPVFVPAHLLLLIAAGLLFGQQGLKKNQTALVVFLAATIVGLIAAWFSIGGEIEVFILGGAAIIGLLIATNPVLPPYSVSLIAAFTGFALGMDSTQETLLGKEKLVSLFGSGIGIYMLLFYPIFFSDYFKKKTWQKIGIRVIGSWVAASSLLVLALSFSSRP